MEISNFMKKSFVPKKFFNRLAKVKYDEKILEVKKVVKVVKGGKNLTYRALVIVGNKKGTVGIGVGRADEANVAIEKASLNAKKNFIKIPITFNYSIPFIVLSSFGASNILLKPASLGHGIIAGGSIRLILELSGIKNIVAKQLGSGNLLNNAKATIIALSKLCEKTQSVRLKSYRYQRLSINNLMK